MRFAIFTHVQHHERDGKFYAYSPYVREMNLWIKNVDEVEIIAPRLPMEEKNVEGLPYRHPNLAFTAIPPFDLLKFISIFKAVFKIPLISFQIAGAMRRADHLHLRCPGNIGLIACLIQIFFPGKSKTAKYAGNWDPKAKQPWTYNLQKWILSNTFLTRNMAVLVYGQWPNQSKNILSFFTASFSENEKENIQKDFKTPYKFLFVGNLVSGKQPLLALHLIDELISKNIPAEINVYGEGPLWKKLEIEAENKDYIHLHGNQPLEILKQAYKESHFLILPSKSEGWPKAVAEAMFFGGIPIATPVSCVSWMLGDGTRGILIHEENSGGNREESGNWKVESQEIVEITVKKIIKLIKKPEEMRRMSMAGQKWSQQYTLEKFEEAIKKVLAPQLPKGEQKE